MSRNLILLISVDGVKEKSQEKIVKAEKVSK